MDDSKAAIQLLPSKPFKAEYVAESMWEEAELSKPAAADQQPELETYQPNEHRQELERIDEEPEKKSDAPANADDEIYF